MIRIANVNDVDSLVELMYDFLIDTTTICDIDFFRKKPTFNDIGENYWGTKRLKAPEEYVYGAVVYEATNVLHWERYYLMLILAITPMLK